MTLRQQVIDPSEIRKGDKLILTAEVTADTYWIGRGDHGGYFNGITKDSEGFGKTFYLSAIHKVVRCTDYPAEPKDNSIVIFRRREQTTGGVGGEQHAAKRTGDSWFVTGNATVFSWASLFKLFPQDTYSYIRW